MTFGQRVERTRNKFNHTREELAEYIGTTPKIVYNVEKGISEPNLMFIEKVCKRYKLSADYLILGDKDAK